MISVDRATIIHPIHTNELKNSTVTPSDKLKRSRAQVRKIKEEQYKSAYVLRGSTIGHSAANERKVVITPNDGIKKDTAQNNNQEDEKKNEISSSIKKNLAALENEIAEIRRRIQQSQDQLRAKLRQTTIVKDTVEEQEDESEVYFESDYDRDCVYSFHKEDDLDDFLKTNTNLHEHGYCRLHADIVQESEIHARALIADGECRFDTPMAIGTVQNALSVDGRKKASSPNFVFTKAFCSHGCEECADPGELPGVNGRP
eukprot:CAMPEP_0168166114 /NCGR_PEP_ID=MMETSP0139_2-20121125/1848_1 /TAXON_ID=44445 /ORGANISM="Pseudo-nitzschia australis, Strain 10249 10 AB" /LENGTH=257 /DNA_ID=CAMNT_0008083277 /DNA_START=38 /DNA_END=809 /DNA_ORIENTATION=-